MSLAQEGALAVRGGLLLRAADRGSPVPALVLRFGAALPSAVLGLIRVAGA